MPAATFSLTPVPWRLFAPHQSEPFAFFIDRGTGSSPSFAGSRPREQLVVDAGGIVRVWREHGWHHEDGDPLERIASFVERSRAEAAGLPVWLRSQALPRTVGFLSYELSQWADGPARKISIAPAPGSADRGAIGTPLAVLSTYDDVDAWDPVTGSVEHVRFSTAPGAAPPPPMNPPPMNPPPMNPPPMNPPPMNPLPVSRWAATARQDYRHGFECVQKAISDGDIYQANLSRRAVFELAGSADAAYGRLRTVQPVAWGALLHFGGFALLSNSPECFLVRHGNLVLTRPIKGTRPRRTDPELDAAERDALRRDPKEMAEHLMIVDLERSDLGRVARTGSVEVPSLAAVESLATVHHMVSEVRAQLREGVDLCALLRATFPGGSITGAPKIRAMEILAEVEAAERGPYTGAIGYFNGGNELELSIAIRTAIASSNRLLYSTGGGIVADSDADREWDETELKLAALRTALAGAGGEASGCGAGALQLPQAGASPPLRESVTATGGRTAGNDGGTRPPMGEKR